MEQRHLLVPLTIALVALLVVVLIITRLASPRPSATESVATSTPPVTPSSQTSSSEVVTTPVSSQSQNTAPRQTETGSALSITPTKGTVPLSTTFTLWLNTTPSCSLVTYVVDFGDNITKQVQVPLNKCTKPYSLTLYHQYQSAGTYTATLSHELSEGRGGVVIGQQTITVYEQSYVTGTTKYGTLSTAPVSGAAPLKVEFSLSATDGSESTGVYYQADFGDGQNAFFPRVSKPTLSHTFTALGGYTVTVYRKTGCSAGYCTGTSQPIAMVMVGVN